MVAVLGVLKGLILWAITLLHMSFLSTDIFERYDTHLVFTGVTRNSKNPQKHHR